MKVLKMIMVGLLAVGASACMPNGKLNSKRAPVNMAGLTGEDGDSSWQSVQFDSRFNCPSSYNVTPEYDWSFDAFHSDFYTVCRKKSDPTKLKSYGVTVDQQNQQTQRICAIPVTMSGSGSNTRYTASLDPTEATNPGPVSDQILDFCYESSNDGYEFSFGNTSFSHLFIVTEEYASQMKACIYSEAYSLCPRYSFGEIK